MDDQPHDIPPERTGHINRSIGKSQTAFETDMMDRARKTRDLGFRLTPQRFATLHDATTRTNPLLPSDPGYASAPYEEAIEPA